MKTQKNGSLINKIKALPKKPGIYLFKNQKGQVIYIGKAMSLRDRVCSYLDTKRLDPKSSLMVSQAAGLDHQVVPSEFEATLLEANLIKKYQPKYNVQLKDDKQYLYIAITQSPFRIFQVRRPELEDKLLDWFGPFPSGRSVRQVLRILRRIFPYCSCKNVPKRQCLFAHLNLCPGYQNLNSQDYQKDIGRIRRVLNGKTSVFLKSLEKKMKQAARELKFEEAQVYKNQVNSLQHVSQGWRPLTDGKILTNEAILRLKKTLSRYQGTAAGTLNKIEGYDVSNLGNQIIVGAMVAFVDGQPEKGLYRKFKIRYHLHGGVKSKLSSSEVKFASGMKATQNDPAAIEQIIYRRLNHPEWLYPQLILVDGGKGQVSAAFKALKAKNLAGKICLLGLAKPSSEDKDDRIIIPRIENKKIVGWRSLKYAARSPVRQLLQQVRDEAHRFAQKYYQTLHLKTVKPVK
jgi:excinuclease ABC subunit C